MNAQIIFVAILFAAIFQLVQSVPRRLSQMEGQKPSQKDSIEKEEESKEATKSEEEIDGENEKEERGNCAEGWENFQNEVCFYGLKAKKGFFEGVKECGKLGATFVSIHSMDEFEFITKHWDLHRFWIGIIYGNSKFEDGTDVDPEVFDEFKKYVPWAWPQVPKGFVCRAKPGDDVKVAVPPDENSVESNENEKDPHSSEEDIQIIGYGGFDGNHENEGRHQNGDSEEEDEGKGLIESSFEEEKYKKN